MGRHKKNNGNNDDNVEIVDSEDNKQKFTLDLDINKLVKDVRGRYSKTQAGLAEDLTTGDNIVLSDDDDDYIVSNEVKFWQPLTGIKGIPFGRIVQISGRPDSGKSTTAMAFMKAAQESRTLVVLWDSEKKFSARHYENDIGGEPAGLAISRSKNIVIGAKEVAWYVRSAKEQNPDIKILIVWDSVGATLNTSEDDDETDDFSKQPGVSARQTSWAIKKFNKLIERYRNQETGKETVAVCCVNQTYANIGSKGQIEKGGGELYYLSSIILNLSRKKELCRVRDKQKMKYGIVSRAKVKKNHLFDGKDCVAEMDLVVSADGIQLARDVKGKDPGITGWDDGDDD